MKLILASASPRRAEVLRDAGISFEVCVVPVEEVARPGEEVEEMVGRLAEEKACAAAAQIHAPAIIIGADTTVEVGGRILGKPRDAAEAREMLSFLSGRIHRVLTGLCVLRVPEGGSRSAVEDTRVTFAPLTQEEIADYVASGEPFDKAGGYAIQGRAGRYITRIEGCYFNVVGLPLARLYPLLKDLGWDEKRSEALGG
jgi:nucleoside triphosphate pyrophosphatase